MNHISNSLHFKYGMFQFFDHFFGKKAMNSIAGTARKNLQRKITQHLKNQGEGELLPIERRKDISLNEFMSEYVKKGKPVVLEGAASDWDCCKKWNLDYFKDLHGDDEIVMIDQELIENPYEELTLRDIINNIQQGGDKYYRFYPLLVRHPEHIADFDYQWLKARRHKWIIGEAFQVFMGGKGTETPIHNANAANLFVQAYGEKRWVLYHHSMTPVVDPDPVRNMYRNAPYTYGKPFNPFDPSYNLYRAYKYIHGYEVHLKPGDVLWNPPYSWHTVQNLTDTIGVGYRWIAPLYTFQLAPLYFFLDLFATNPPFLKSLKLFKKDFNLVQLAETGRLDEYLQNQTSQ